MSTLRNVFAVYDTEKEKKALFDDIHKNKASLFYIKSEKLSSQIYSFIFKKKFSLKELSVSDNMNYRKLKTAFPLILTVFALYVYFIVQELSATEISARGMFHVFFLTLGIIVGSRSLHKMKVECIREEIQNFFIRSKMKTEDEQRFFQTFYLSTTNKVEPKTQHNTKRL